MVWSPSLFDVSPPTDMNRALESSRHRTPNLPLRLGIRASAFGMIGTLIGLIQMLTLMDDPEVQIVVLQAALLTTLYGALISNVFAPLAEKLDIRAGYKERITKGC